MSEFEIFDSSGKSHSAVLVDGVPEIERDFWPYPVFSFQVKFRNMRGTIRWYVEGKLHHLNGPAVEYADGYKKWYIKGKELTREVFNSRMSKL